MFISKISRTFFYTLIAAVALVGCDSNDGDDEGPSDAERFLGTWAVVSAADQDGARDQTAVFSGLGVLSVDLKDDGTYSLLLQYNDPAEEDLSLMGPYTVNSAGGQLILTVSLSGLTVNLPFAYEFLSDTSVELTVDGPTLSLLLGAALEDNVVLGIQKTS